MTLSCTALMLFPDHAHLGSKAVTMRSSSDGIPSFTRDNPDSCVPVGIASLKRATSCAPVRGTRAEHSVNVGHTSLESRRPFHRPLNLRPSPPVSRQAVITAEGGNESARRCPLRWNSFGHERSIKGGK